jgi:hypothetical protein
MSELSGGPCYCTRGVNTHNCPIHRNDDDLLAAVARRRSDPAFKARLERILSEEKAILDRLAQSDDASASSRAQAAPASGQERGDQHEGGDKDVDTDWAEYALRQRVHDSRDKQRQGTVIAIYHHYHRYGVNWDVGGIREGMPMLMRPVLDSAGAPVFLPKKDES